MKLLIFITLSLLLALAAFGQTATPEPPAMPTYVGIGAAFNQIGTPRWNAWAGAVYPVSQPAKLYLSTVADIVPLLQTDAATQRRFYAFSSSIRQGAHRVIGTWGKFSVLLGGDAGAGFSQASPSGLNVTFAGSFTATAVYQISPKWAAVVPIRALWLGESKTWNALPELGLFFKP